MKAVGSLKISCTFWIIVILYSGERIDQALASAGKAISNSSTERNKAIVLEAFDAMFNKSDYVAADASGARSSVVLKHFGVFRPI